MMNMRGSGLIVVGSVLLAIAGACGSSPTSVEERSELHGSGPSIAACCQRAFRSGWLRGHCLAEAAHGRGVCGHLRPHDGGRCDAAAGGSGGVGGTGGVAGTGGEAGAGEVAGHFGESILVTDLGDEVFEGFFDFGRGGELRDRGGAGGDGVGGL